MAASLAMTLYTNDVSALALFSQQPTLLTEQGGSFP